jgi:hypothetical protein
VRQLVVEVIVAAKCVLASETGNRHTPERKGKTHKRKSEKKTISPSIP